MRQGWIEFIAGRNGEKYCVRPERIVSFDELTEEGEVTIMFEAGNEIAEFNTCEPYEQVKQKIVDAEKVDLSNMVVEHFTKDEYELLLNAVGYLEAACNDTKENIEFAKRLEPLGKLKIKLNEILKEAK